MTPEEVERFLEEQRTITVATLGGDGWPHVTALWYVLRDCEPWIFTYGKSQKVRNLERDSRATLLVESGRQYGELRGVMLAARAEIHRGLDTVTAVAEEIFSRYGGDSGASAGDRLGGSTREAVRARVAKRVAVRFRVVRTVSWDHSKLGGAY
jgi:PPOX class probable F420-dependent enzyme